MKIISHPRCNFTQACNKRNGLRDVIAWLSPLWCHQTRVVPQAVWKASYTLCVEHIVLTHCRVVWWTLRLRNCVPMCRSITANTHTHMYVFAVHECSTRLFQAHHHYLCPRVELSFKYANSAGGGCGKVIVELVEFDSLPCCVCSLKCALSTDLTQKPLCASRLVYFSTANKKGLNPHGLYFG